MIEGVPFLKMSGAGNDFVVLDPDGAQRVAGALGVWTRRVCRRGLSVGADGLLLVEPVAPGRVRVLFLNPDGSEAFCGNGSRCAARFAALRGFTGATLVLETAAGEVPAEVEGASVRLRLPAPSDGGELVLEAPGGGRVAGRWVVAGAPHFVIRVADVGHAPLALWGPAFRRHPRFGPGGTNVDVVQHRDDGVVAMRTWERGVEGETLACGSGAVAAALAATIDRGATGAVQVLPASGVPLSVDVGPAPGISPAILAGDARVVFAGTVTAEGVAGFPAC